MRPFRTIAEMLRSGLTVVFCPSCRDSGPLVIPRDASEQIAQVWLNETCVCGRFFELVEPNK